MKVGHLTALRRINLNLLPVLSSLLNTVSVSQTAQELNLTQSAVSISLRKLREMFDDELLVLRGRNMALTPTAEQLIESVGAFVTAANALIHSPPFDHETSTHRFVIASADYVSALLLPKLLPRLKEIAPYVSIQILLGGPSVGRDIEQGIIDLIIAPPKINEWLDIRIDDENSPFDYEAILQEEMVCIAAIDDDTVGEQIDLETFIKKHHAAFWLERDMPANVAMDTLQRLNVEPRAQFLGQQFTLLPMIVERCHNLAIVPQSIATMYEKIHSIRQVETPITFDPINLVMAWSKAQTKDPALSWIREEIQKVFKSHKEGTINE